jgi:hypothetical protein
MSELDRMMAYGRWLTERKETFKAQLCALGVDRTKDIDSIRIKAGHLEATTLALEAFTFLYKTDVTKFAEAYLGQEPEEEDKESTDG